MKPARVYYFFSITHDSGMQKSFKLHVLRFSRTLHSCPLIFAFDWSFVIEPV